MIQVEASVRAEMRRLYEEENWSLRELAAKYGLTHEGVRYRLTALGVQMRQRGLGGPPIDADELRRLYVEDLLPVGHVAKRFKASAGRVVRELERHGIEKRGHGFYLVKHRELAHLKVGEWIDVPPASPNSPPYPTFYDMAKREGHKDLRPEGRGRPLPAHPQGLSSPTCFGGIHYCPVKIPTTPLVK